MDSLVGNHHDFASPVEVDLEAFSQSQEDFQICASASPASVPPASAAPAFAAPVSTAPVSTRLLAFVASVAPLAPPSDTFQTVFADAVLLSLAAENVVVVVVVE